MKKILIASLIILMLPIFAFAQSSSAGGCGYVNGNPPNLGACVNQIYIWALAAAGMIAVVMIVVGGYITLTAAGNGQRAALGKSYITSSVIGLVLLFGAYILLRTINPDLVDFSKNCIATNPGQLCGSSSNNPSGPPPGPGG
jgi:hypothetical protein